MFGWHLAFWKPKFVGNFSCVVEEILRWRYKATCTILSSIASILLWSLFYRGCV